jgi:hypothetical protein
MSQQQHDVGYMDYSAPPNRPPSSSRQPYGGNSAFGPGLSLPRQSQRPFDAPLGSSALYNADRMPSGFNPRMVENNMTPGGGMPNYMMDANQPWGYGSSGAATVNGAVNGPGRNRSVNRRAALPQVCQSATSLPCIADANLPHRPGPTMAPWECTTTCSPSTGP